MAEIKDTGKVWFPGKFGPEFALRVDEKIFVPGREEEQEIHYWIDYGNLCVDLHDSAKKKRIARRFPLELVPTRLAALFNGFENTKHGDVTVVTHEDRGVQQLLMEGEQYIEKKIETMDSRAFWSQVETSLG